MSSVLRHPDSFALDSHTRDEIASVSRQGRVGGGTGGDGGIRSWLRGRFEGRRQSSYSPRIIGPKPSSANISRAWLPLTPLCAEEAMAAGAQPQVAERFLLVDPLDGTREFLAGNGEFTINVALIESGRSGRRRRLRAGDRPVVGRWRHGVRVRSAPRRRVARRRIAAAHSELVSAPIELGRFCKPFASRRPSRTPSSKDCPLGRRGSRVRRSSFALSPRASATSIRGSRQRWNGTPRRATRFCARPAAPSSILQDGACVRQEPRAVLRNGPFIAWGDPTAAKRLGY